MNTIYDPTSFEMMITLRAALDKTVSGPKKVAAETHLRAAEMAKFSKRDPECAAALTAGLAALR